MPPLRAPPLTNLRTCSAADSIDTRPPSALIIPSSEPSLAGSGVSTTVRSCVLNRTRLLDRRRVLPVLRRAEYGVTEHDDDDNAAIGTLAGVAGAASDASATAAATAAAVAATAAAAAGGGGGSTCMKGVRGRGARHAVARGWGDG